MTHILVTGGAGFIGANFVHHVVKERPHYRVIVLDKLTYAGNYENLKPVLKDIVFVQGDIRNEELVRHLTQHYAISGIINFAAESHVDRSISGPQIFTETNVLGTQSLLEVARHSKIKRFLQVSTDEVYGSLGQSGYFTEQTPLAPSSPYSASKAAADVLVQAYVHTFGLNAVITRCSNNYGPYQFPEKLIPLMLTQALNDAPLPVYGNGQNIRDWLHVSDHCRAVLLAYEKGISGEVYNVGGNNEWANLAIVKLLLKELQKPESLIKFVQDRPGHDLRYAIDASKIRSALGFSPLYTFERGIRETIQWYLDNRDWWQRILSGEYRHSAPQAGGQS